MKLKFKLTLLCALLLFLVAVSLTGAMLWQVREQSYELLTQSTEETLNGLVSGFTRLLYSAPEEALEGPGRGAFLTYSFRSQGIPGSILVADGACLTASTPIAPEQDWPQRCGRGLRVSSEGRNYLVLGQSTTVLDIPCSIYLVADASHIQRQLWQLSGRYALLALAVGFLGLGAVYGLVSRTLRPLAELSRAAERIAAGNYSQRVPQNAADEVGLLAGSFNRMAQAVQTHVDTLQEQNARQTLFLRAVTHELKTPLTSLLLNVNTLQTLYLPQEQQEALLESMDTQLHWLETMVKKLLTLLSMKKKVQPVPTDIPALLAQARELTRPICQKYGVTLYTDCRISTLVVDQDLICSALVNLIENSAKASLPGSGIWLRAGATGFTVEDRGRGIPPQDLHRVTDPFYMGDPSRSKSTGGFGLGLALVREVALAHGGTLDLESTEGIGTTARILLPGCNGNQTVMGR